MRTLFLFLFLILGYSSALVGMTLLLTELVRHENCVGSLCLPPSNSASPVGPKLNPLTGRPGAGDPLFDVSGPEEDDFLDQSEPAPAEQLQRERVLF